MDAEGQLIFGGLGFALAIVAATGLVVRGRDARDTGAGWRRWVVVPSAAAILAWLVFHYYVLTHAASDMGPDYPTSSAYGRYREAIYDSDIFVAATGSAYALAAGLLALAALAASRRGSGLAVVCAVFTCVAVALPGFLPSLLSRAPGDEVQFGLGSAYYDGSEPPVVKACFDRSARSMGPDYDPDSHGPELCLSLTSTFEARALIHPAQIPTPATDLPEPDPSLEDIGDALTEQQLEVGETPGQVGLDGIEIVGADWGS